MRWNWILGILAAAVAVVLVVGASFMGTALADITSLDVAYQDAVVHTFNRDDSSSYPNVAEDLDGTLLYRSRLIAPLDRLELIAAELKSLRQLLLDLLNGEGPEGHHTPLRRDPSRGPRKRTG